MNQKQASRGLDLLMTYETEGLESTKELFELADYVYTTGLFRSTGSYGRFLEAMHAEGWDYHQAVGR